MKLHPDYMQEVCEMIAKEVACLDDPRTSIQITTRIAVKLFGVDPMTAYRTIFPMYKDAIKKKEEEEQQESDAFQLKLKLIREKK